MQLDHKHLIINGFCKKPIVDPRDAEVFLSDVVSAIGMKIKVGPFADYCLAEGNNGITGAVCIETSHCSIHVWDQVEKPYFRMDIYSCAAFDPIKVLQMAKDKFDAHGIQYIVIGRNDVEGEPSLQVGLVNIF
jgi:S-adenosylmethionine/arginine decarboxylase-like enzyme